MGIPQNRSDFFNQSKLGNHIMAETTLDQSTELDPMDALLDGTLDDLADIPEFRQYPVGAHKVKMSWILNHTIPNAFNKKGDESSGLKKFVQLKCVAIETVEMPAGSTDAPLEPGAPFQQNFDLTNEWAQGAFKVIMTSLSQHYGAKSNRDLIKDSEGAEVVITIKHRKDKNDKEKFYAQIDNLMVV